MAQQQFSFLVMDLPNQTGGVPFDTKCSSFEELKFLLANKFGSNFATVSSVSFFSTEWNEFVEVTELSQLPPKCKIRIGAPPPSLSAQAPPQPVQDTIVFPSDLGTIPQIIDREESVVPFLNRVLELRHLLSIFLSNYALQAMNSQENTYSWRLPVLAQHLGSGKTSLVKNFPIAALRILDDQNVLNEVNEKIEGMGMKQRSAKDIGNILQEFDFISIDFREYRKHMIMLPTVVDCIQLVVANTVASYGLLKENLCGKKMSTSPGPLELVSMMKKPVCWHFDEIDQVFEVGDKKWITDVDEQAERIYPLLDITKQLMRKGHQVIISGRSPVLSLLGNGYWDALTTPLSFKVDLIILDVLHQNHIATLLGNYSHFAETVLKWTAGIPRLVMWARDYLIETKGTSGLEIGFMAWLARTQNRLRNPAEELSGWMKLPTQWRRVYIRVAEFALFGIPLPLNAQVPIRNGEKLEMLQFIRNLQIYVRNVDRQKGTIAVLFPQAIIEDMAIKEEVTYSTSPLVIPLRDVYRQGAAAFVDKSTTLEILPFRMIFWRFNLRESLWRYCNPNARMLEEDCEVFSKCFAGKMPLLQLPMLGFGKIVTATGSGGAKIISKIQDSKEKHDKIAELTELLNQPPRGDLQKHINVADWELIRKVAPENGAHIPLSASASADGYFHTTDCELHLQSKSKQSINASLIAEEFAKVNTQTPRNITFAIIGLEVDKTIDSLKLLKPEEVKSSTGELLALCFRPGAQIPYFTSEKVDESKKQKEEMKEKDSIKQEKGQEKSKTKSTKAKKRQKISHTLVVPANADILIITKAGYEQILTKDVAQIVFETMDSQPPLLRTPSIIPLASDDTPPLNLI